MYMHMSFETLLSMLWRFFFFCNMLDMCWCFGQKCLSAPSYSDDELSIVECNSTAALLMWQLGQHEPKLSSLGFEYSCLKVTSEGLIPIVMNKTLPWHTDGSAGFTSISLVPEATCLFSACYADQSSGTIYISPTGCLAVPPITARSAFYNTASYSHLSVVSTDGLIIASTFALKESPSQQKTNGVNRIKASIAALVVAFIAIIAIGLLIGLCIFRALQRNFINKELRQLGVELTEKVDKSYAPVDINTHDGSTYFTSQISILDTLDHEKHPALTHQSFHACSVVLPEQGHFLCEGYSINSSKSHDSSNSGYAAE